MPPKTSERPAPLLDSAFQRSEPPAPSNENAPLVKKTRPKKHDLVAEGNVVACCCIFVSAVAFDALNALPTTVVADVPVSMRTTSLILIALIAAPPVEPHYLFEQRALAFVLLAVSAWVGLHHGGPNARVADATYCLLGGWAAVLIYALSGPVRGERGHDGRGRRENIVALSAAFLAYAGLRVVRASLSHASEVVQFTVSKDDVSARGFALADDLIAASHGFGGLICVSASVVVLINHDLIYEHGCTPVCTVLAMMSVLVFTAAFVIQITSYARLDDMTTLFGDGACTGLVDVCEMTYRARRMYSANSSPATLWACAVGLTIFAFPYERRCRTRREYFTPEQELLGAEASKAAGWVALLSAAVALVAVYIFSDGSSTLASLELLLLYFSIPVAWFGDSWIACGLHAAGITVYTIERLGSPFGFDLAYLTHWNVAATLVVTLLLAVTTGVTQFLYSSCCSRGRFATWVETGTACGLVALVSMQLSLTIGALGIVSGYDGSRFGDGLSWRATSFQWATQHCISFFFAAALVGGRYECQYPYIERWILQLIWFSVPVGLVVAWICAMAAVQTTVPYTQTGNVLSLSLSALAAVVPWTVVGVIVC